MCWYSTLKFPCNRELWHWCRCTDRPEDYIPRDANSPWAQGAVLCNDVGIGTIILRAKATDCCWYPECTVCPRPARPGQPQQPSAAEMQNHDFFRRFSANLDRLEAIAPGQSGQAQERQLKMAFTQTLIDLGLQERSSQQREDNNNEEDSDDESEDEDDESSSGDDDDDDAQQEQSSLPDLAYYTYIVNGQVFTLEGFTQVRGPAGQPASGAQPHQPAVQTSHPARRAPSTPPSGRVFSYISTPKTYVQESPQWKAYNNRNRMQSAGSSTSQPAPLPTHIDFRRTVPVPKPGPIYSRNPPAAEPRPVYSRNPPPAEPRPQFQRNPPAVAPRPAYSRHPPDPAAAATATPAEAQDGDMSEEESDG